MEEQKVTDDDSESGRGRNRRNNRMYGGRGHVSGQKHNKAHHEQGLGHDGVWGKHSRDAQHSLANTHDKASSPPMYRTDGECDEQLNDRPSKSSRGPSGGRISRVGSRGQDARPCNNLEKAQNDAQNDAQNNAQSNHASVVAQADAQQDDAQQDDVHMVEADQPLPYAEQRIEEERERLELLAINTATQEARPEHTPDNTTHPDHINPVIPEDLN
jgi:hypothetical protein